MKVVIIACDTQLAGKLFNMLPRGLCNNASIIYYKTIEKEVLGATALVNVGVDDEDQGSWIVEQRSRCMFWGDVDRVR